MFLDLELNDEPETEIQHQGPLTIEISHSIVQTTSGKNNYCPLFILLLLSLFAQIPNGQKIYNVYFSYNIYQGCFPVITTRLTKYEKTIFLTTLI